MPETPKQVLKKGLNRLREMLNRLTNRNRNEPVPSVVWHPDRTRKHPNFKP